MNRPQFNMPKPTRPKQIREGSNRAVLKELLERGATFEECMAATWGKRRDRPMAWRKRMTIEALRLLCKYNGYGLRETRDGVIHLVK